MTHPTESGQLVTRTLAASREFVCAITMFTPSMNSSAEDWISALGKPSGAHLIADAIALRRNSKLRDTLGEIRSGLSRSTFLETHITEKSKSIRSLQHIVRWLDDNKVARRSEPVVAVGGGALLDTVSFAASIYRRGITFIKVPTTLTGIVDAAVGAKNGVNFEGRKNLIGTYYPASTVLIDNKLLATLPIRHLRAGAAEIVKAALARDAGLFSELEANISSLLRNKFQSSEGFSVIVRSIDVLTQSIWADLWEHHLDREMDLGHSISKILEQRLTPRPSHGEAVMLDMAITVSLAHQLGILDESSFRRCINLFRRVGLPIVRHDINGDILHEALMDTVIHRNGERRCPVPGPIGSIRYLDVSTSYLMAAQESLIRRVR